ncbi:MAG: aspartate:alanine exchanger family transporter, partial [Opitutales bacterium]
MNFQVLHELLQRQPLLALFATVALGLLLGRISIKGIQLGSSGVLFTALLAGHLGYSVPGGVGTLGLVLFVYCVGIGAGGRFFASVMRDGATLAKLACIIVATGGLVTWIGARWMELPVDLAAGIFAGALTSTPALAASVETFSGAAPGVSIGYGIAYPVGAIGVVLFVQVLPRILRYDLNAIAAAETDNSDFGDEVSSVLVEVTNQNLFGKNIATSGITHFNACQISRVYREDQLVPIKYDDCYAEGQLLLLVGKNSELDLAIDYLGVRSDRPILLDAENERRKLLVTDRGVAGKSLQDLAPLKNYGIIITRITRLGITFVPGNQTVIEVNDQITAVGQSGDLEQFAKAVGHRSNAIDTTDLLSLSAGLSMGILLGLTPFALPGGSPVTLGLAGGPLLVALLLGHFGKVGNIVGHIPRPTRMLLQELGLVFFLAHAGIRGGSAFVETFQQYGVPLLLLSACITFLPILFAWFLARRCFKLNPLQSLGGICGSMTSTPALGAITEKTDSQMPVVSYASAYPIALIVMILFAKTLIG